MVARGDCIEVPYQDVPLAKNDGEKVFKASKPIIVATQMMESMIDGILRQEQRLMT